MNHPSPDDLETFVVGQMPPAQVIDLGRHLSQCAACSERLQEEAQLERALFEVARHQRQREVASRRRRTTAALVTIAAVCLVAVLGMNVRHAATHPWSPATDTRASLASVGVHCPETPGQLACIAEAHRHGLYVGSPAWAGVPPLDARAEGALAHDGTFLGGEL